MMKGTKDLVAAALLSAALAAAGCGGGGGGGTTPQGGGPNTAPVAAAGADQRVRTAATVTLDGSGSSDADGDALTYAWAFLSKPAGSGATLSDTAASRPTFTADRDGVYVLGLTVDDGIASSTTDTVEIASATYDFGALDQSRIDTSAPCDTSAGTTIPGGNVINQTWTAAGSPYIVQGDIIVPAGSTLAIQPGVTVCSAPTDTMAAGIDTTKVEITVNGTLTVAGSAAAPVIFRSVDATNAVTWQGLIISSGSTSNTVDYAYIANANQGIQKSGPLTVSHSVFMNNAYGVYMSNSGIITSSVFLKNTYGVRSTGSSQLTNLLAYQNTYGLLLTLPNYVRVYNCTIDGNSSYGIYVQSSLNHDADIMNSIITNNGNYGVYNSGSGLVTTPGNDIWGNGTDTPSALSINPLYIAAPFSYALSPGSPCIDAGLDVSTFVPDDILGTARPQDGDGIAGAAFDLGAYER